MEKYKVLMVHNYYQIPGGENVVFESESKLLEENGHKVYQYTRNNAELKNINLLQKIKLFLETIYSFKTYREVRKILRENKIDIVHVHNTLPLVSPSVYYAAFHEKVPVVQTIHNFRLLCPGATFYRAGLICEECLEKGFRCALKHKCYRNSFIQTLTMVCMLKFHRLIGTYKRVNGYIALTEFNKGKISRLVDNNKIFIKPNFVFNNSNVNKTNIIDEDYFVFIGRVDKLKGVELLIEAWAEIKDYKLLIIGSGPEEENIKEKINKYKLDNIDLLGFKKHEEAFKIIENSHAVIIPSQWYEPFGMIVIESFSLGVPVIAGAIGSLPSIIQDGHNGILFEYNKKEKLVESILKVSEDREFRNTLAIGAKNSYLKYTDSENYKTLIEIYNGLIK